MRITFAHKPPEQHDSDQEIVADFEDRIDDVGIEKAAEAFAAIVDPLKKHIARNTLRAAERRNRNPLKVART